MKARLEGEDWDALEATMKEFSKLNQRDEFAKRVTKLKDDAAHMQAEKKKAILTATAQAKISEIQSLIDRYLEDETYTAYAESLERGRKEAVETKSDTKAPAALECLSDRPRRRPAHERAPRPQRQKQKKSMNVRSRQSRIFPFEVMRQSRDSSLDRPCSFF